MAKKKVESSEPKISSIPVPPSDSALVIDLPDGQKLLVGKIEAGTVIEVATWRGTGRPDSRTNRLMLGMSNENEVKQPEPEVAPTPARARDLKFPKNVQFFALNFFNKALPVIKLALLKIFNFIRGFKWRNISFQMPKFSKLKLENKFKKSPESTAAKSLELDDDFDVDFQRILDEVSQRRSGNSKKPSRSNGASDEKGISEKRKSGKSKKRG